MNLIPLATSNKQQATSNKQQATSNKQQGSFYLFSACKKVPSVCKGGVF